MGAIKAAICALLAYTTLLCAGKKAFVNVPVADLVGEPLKSEIAYRSLAWACRPKKHDSLRVGQLLFNEIVTIIKEDQQGLESLVRVHHTFYRKPGHLGMYNEFWILKKNLTPFEFLTPDQRLSLVPEPISYHKNNQTDQDTVGLIAPWYDKITKQTYSAGTRFKCAHHNSDSCTVWLFDKRAHTFKKSSIPKNLVQCALLKTNRQKIDCFVTILTKWAHCHKGFIPYVWGGNSFIEHTTKEALTDYYQPKNSKQPHAGFDCSGLISRAAQLAGIPYFFKNTYTVAHALRPLTKDQMVHNGDLIWFPGHVIVISDVTHHKLIEARHYAHGYGKIHEISLHEQFDGITTYPELIQALHQGKELIRLDKNGKKVERIKTFKILNIESAWDYT